MVVDSVNFPRECIDVAGLLHDLFSNKTLMGSKLPVLIACNKQGVCVHVCVHVCVWVWVGVCVCVCVCVGVCVRVWGGAMLVSSFTHELFTMILCRYFSCQRCGDD